MMIMMILRDSHILSVMFKRYIGDQRIIIIISAERSPKTVYLVAVATEGTGGVFSQ